MATNVFSRPIVTDGLVFSVDPYNIKSYVSGDTTVSDMTVSSNNGTLTNGVTFNGNSWVFNGTNQYIDFGNLPEFEFTGSFTVSGWVKVVDRLGTNVIIEKGAGGTLGWSVQIDDSKLLIRTNSTDAEADLTDNDWHYFTGGYDGTNIFMYLDGEFVQQTVVTLLANSDKILSVGAGFTGPGAGSATIFTDGEISLLKIYDRALSSTEIKQNYIATKHRFTYFSVVVAPLNPLNFKAYYVSKLSEGSVNGKTAANFVLANEETLSSDSTDFDFADTDWTICCWFAPTTVGIWNRVCGKQGLSPDYSLQIFVTNTNYMRIAISTNGTTFGTTFTSTLVPSLNTWAFWVFSYDAAANILSIQKDNGTAQTVSHSGGVFPVTDPFRLGGSHTAYSDSNIDTFSVYSEVISAADITALYNSGAGIAYEDLAAAQLTNLVSWWDLNELSGERFDSHGANHLTDNNTVGSALGKVVENANSGTYVAKFVKANSEELETSDSAFDFGDTDFTISGWARVDIATGGSERFAGKWRATGSNKGFIFRIGTLGRPEVYISNNGSTTSIFLSTFQMVADRWYYLVMTHDATANLIGISMDGAAVETFSHSGGVYASTEPFALGAHDSAFFLGGQLSSWSVYSDVRSNAEILASYNNRYHLYYADFTTDQKTNLIAHWDLKEQSGTRFDNHTSSLDLTDINTVTSTPYRQESVFQVLDGGGVSIHMEQSTFAAQPLYLDEYLVFDGVDDVLTNSTANIFSSDSSGYIFFAGIWTGLEEWWLSSCSTDTAYYVNIGVRSTGKITFVQRNASDTGDEVNSTTSLVSGSYYYGYVKSNGTSYEINLNGTIETIVVVQGSNNGDWYGDTPTNRPSLTMGCFLLATPQYRQAKIKALWYTSEAEGDAHASDYLTTLKGLET